MEKTKTSAALGQGKKGVSCPEGIYLGYGCRVWEDVKGSGSGTGHKERSGHKEALALWGWLWASLEDAVAPGRRLFQLIVGIASWKLIHRSTYIQECYPSFVGFCL